jgi:hypothetical protein
MLWWKIMPQTAFADARKQHCKMQPHEKAKAHPTMGWLMLFDGNHRVGLRGAFCYRISLCYRRDRETRYCQHDYHETVNRHYITGVNE